MTVKGVSSLPLALLPLGTLDGAKVAKWRRVAWAVAYAVGLAAFMLVLLTIPKAWGEIPGDFVRWLVIFGSLRAARGRALGAERRGGSSAGRRRRRRSASSPTRSRSTDRWSRAQAAFEPTA